MQLHILYNCIQSKVRTVLCARVTTTTNAGMYAIFCDFEEDFGSQTRRFRLIFAETTKVPKMREDLNSTRLRLDCGRHEGSQVCFLYFPGPIKHRRLPSNSQLIRRCSHNACVCGSRELTPQWTGWIVCQFLDFRCWFESFGSYTRRGDQ